jgi:hypothetical protein
MEPQILSGGVGGRNRTVGRKALIVIGACLIGIALLAGAGLLLARYWMPILFWGYWVVALVMFLVSMRGNFILLQPKSILDPLAIESEVIRAQVNRSRFQKVRVFIIQVLTSAADAIGWPTTLLALGVGAVKDGLGKEKVGSRAFLAAFALNAPIVTAAVATCAMAIGVAATDRFLPPGLGYRRTFLLLLALAVMIRNLTYIFNFTSLPTMLRRSIGDPYVRFVLIGAANLLTLILAFGAWSAWETGQVLGFERLRSMTVELLTLARLRAAAIDGAPIDALGLLASLAGALYLVSGFKTIFEHQQFKRDTEDFHAIASLQIAIGKPREGRRWLDKVTKREALTYELYIAVYLALGDVEQAEQMARALLDENKVEAAAQPQEAIRFLIGAGVGTPMSKERRAAALQRWLAAGYPDLFLHNGVSAVLTQAQLTPDEVLGLMPDDAAVRRGLSLGVALMTRGNYDDAAKVLRAYATSGPIEELVRLCLLHRCLAADALDNPSDEAFRELAEWRKTDGPKLLELAGKARTDYERLLVIENVYIIRDLSEVMDPAGAAPWDALLQEAKDELGGDERILTTLRAIEGMHVSRQRQFAALRDQIPMIGDPAAGG